MKFEKITTLLLLSCLLFSLFSCFPLNGQKAEAEKEKEAEEENEALVYTENEDGYTVALVPDADVTGVEIPESYNGKPVTEIAENGFNTLFVSAKIKEIKIPSSLKRIGADAFDGMNTLGRVEITDLYSYLKIEFKTPFSNPLVFADSLYVGDELLTELEIPESITEIKNYAFLSYKSIVSLTLHDGVEKIGVFLDIGKTRM